MTESNALRPLSKDEEWVLAKLLYERMCRADPSPDDEPWADLEMRERAHYRRLAIDLVDGFTALRKL